MDVALFSVSAALSIYLPKCVFHSQSTTEQSSMAVTVGLSLGLFSLSLLEAAPECWLWLLSPDVPTGPRDAVIVGSSTTGFLTITRAYWLMLWTMCLVLLVALPCVAGVAVADSLGHIIFPPHSTSNNCKYLPFYWRMCPWWLRFIASFIKVIIKRIFSCFGRLVWRRNDSSSLTVITTTNASSHDEEMRQLKSPGSADLELRPSPSSNNQGQSLPLHHSHTHTHTHQQHHQHPHHLHRHLVSSNHRFLTTLGSICGVSIVLVAVSSLGPVVVQTPTDKSALSVLVSWLCAVGFLISSFLNGFGSVSMPYSCLAGLYLKPVGPEVISKLEGERQSVLEALTNKRTSLREVTLNVSRRSSSHTPSSSGMSSKSPNSNSLTKAFRSFSELGEELSHRKQVVQTEIDFLETLYKDMGHDIEELRESQRVAASARTTMGKVRSYVGLVFSIILLLRLLSASWVIWKSYTMDIKTRKVPRADIITTVLLWLWGHNFVSQNEYSDLSQLVSLIVTAILSVSQVRTFLRTLAFVNRRFATVSQSYSCMKKCRPMDSFSSSSSSSSTNDDNNASSYYDCAAPSLFSQLIAITTGCYFLSCIVLIKMMLPEEVCEGFASALGGMDVFTIRTVVVNSAFCCSAGISATALGMLFAIQRQNNIRHSKYNIVGGSSTSNTTTVTKTTSSSSSSKSISSPSHTNITGPDAC